MAWTCKLCKNVNMLAPTEYTPCTLCALPRDAKSVTSDSICVLHSTLEPSFDAIVQNGFKITANPLAGRSMGDVIYGYVFRGGSLKGSVTHAVNGCWNSNPRCDKFVNFQLRFDLPFDKVFVFDQEQWEKIMSEPARPTSHAALLRMYGPRFANAAKQRVQFHNAERIRKQGKDARVPDPEQPKPDHIAEAAHALGSEAFYTPLTGVILFYRPEQLAEHSVWFKGTAPAQGNSDEAARLLERADAETKDRYQAMPFNSPAVKPSGWKLLRTMKSWV